MSQEPDALTRLADRLPQPVGALLRVEQVRYLVVAGTTSLFYLALVATGLWLGLHYMVAIAAAQAVTISGAFPAYRHLVFVSRSDWRGDLVRFLSVWSSGMVAGFLATPFLVEVVGISPLPAQVLAIIVVAVGSYLGHRYITFRQRPTTSEG